MSIIYVIFFSLFFNTQKKICRPHLRRRRAASIKQQKKTGIPRHKFYPQHIGGYNRFSCVSLTCLLSFSLQPCSLIWVPAMRSTTVRHRSMCFTDLSLVKAHSWTHEAKRNFRRHSEYPYNQGQSISVLRIEIHHEAHTQVSHSHYGCSFTRIIWNLSPLHLQPLNSLLPGCPHLHLPSKLYSTWFCLL